MYQFGTLSDNDLALIYHALAQLDSLEGPKGPRHYSIDLIMHEIRQEFTQRAQNHQRPGG